MATAMETSNDVWEAHLYYRQGTSDKVYYAAVVRDEATGMFSTPFGYGRRGSALKMGFKARNVSERDALAAYNKVVSEKRGEGYVDGPAVTSGYVPPPNTTGESAQVPVQLLSSGPLADIDRFVEDPRWSMQEKHDGQRLLVRVGAGAPMAYNREGKPRAIATSLAAALMQYAHRDLAPVLLDGELIGETYHAFDLLEKGGQNLRGMGYADRRFALEAMFAGTGDGYAPSPLRLVTTAIAREQKRTLVDSVRARGGEGIVAKLDAGTHIAGRSAAAIKFKFTAGLTAVVVKQNITRSVQLKLYDEEGRSVIVGNVTIPANFTVPPVGAFVEVEYLYCLCPGGSLFQPVYKGERDDVGPDDCTTDQIKYKGAGSEDEG